ALDALRSGLPDASFINATPILGELRAVKQPAELERLRQVHQVTAQAIRAVLAEGRPEHTTRQIAGMVQRRIEERGAGFLYVFTNVGPGFLRAPSSIQWGRGRPMHVDAGAEMDEYIADIARMGSIGAPPALAMDLFTEIGRASCRERVSVWVGVVVVNKKGTPSQVPVTTVMVE